MTHKNLSFSFLFFLLLLGSCLLLLASCLLLLLLLLAPRVSPRNGTVSAAHVDAAAASSSSSAPTSSGGNTQSLDLASAVTPGVGVPLMLSGTLLGRRFLLVAAPQLKGRKRVSVPFCFFLLLPVSCFLLAS